MDLIDCTGQCDRVVRVFNITLTLCNQPHQLLLCAALSETPPVYILLLPGATSSLEILPYCATLRLEERRRREAQAFTLAYQNRGLDRVGQALM